MIIDKVFSDLENCPKCGNTDKHLEYFCDCRDLNKEWLKVICVRCNYAWYRKPLDAKD